MRGCMQAVFRDETGGNTCSQSRAREGMASGMLLTECTSFAPQLLQVLRVFFFHEH